MQTSTLKRHADLMDRMAGTLGLDLEEKALRGDLPFDEIADAVMRCTGCTGAGACEKWLQDHADGAEQTPHYCRNADLFKTLR
ncbi:MAG: DUF6455 family protein [Pseudomonadota bacterium]